MGISGVVLQGEYSSQYQIAQFIPLKLDMREMEFFNERFHIDPTYEDQWKYL